MTHRVFLSVAGIPFLLCAEIFGTQAKEIRPLFVQRGESPLPGSGKISPVGDQIRPVVGRSEHPPPPHTGTRDKEQCAFVSPGQSGTTLASATSTTGPTVTPAPRGPVRLAARSSPPTMEMERDWGGGERLGRYQPS